MTDDPKRWVDDDDAPPALRDYLKGVRSDRAALSDELRAQIRRALASEADTIDHYRRARAASPYGSGPGPRTAGDADRADTIDLAARRGPSVVVMVALMAAVVLLGLVLYGEQGPIEPVPAVGPEPIDAGPDAPSLEPIELERICGDREDSDWQCDLSVLPIQPYERLELHAATGIRAPSCDGTAEQHRDSVEGPFRFVLSDGASEGGWRAFTVCGYRDGILRGAGTIEGRRGLPNLALGRRRGGDDLRLSLEDVDDDITRLEVRWVPPEPDDMWGHSVLDGCPGEPVMSLSRETLERLLGRHGLEVFRSVVNAEAREPTFVLCAFSDAGAHHTRIRYRFPEEEQPFVRTSSGELSLDQFRGELPVLGPQGIVTITHLDGTWPGSAAARRASARTLARMEEGTATPPRELILANGQVLLLPRGATLGPRSAGTEPRVATLRDGTTSAVLGQRVLTEGAPEDGDHVRIPRNAVLTSSGPASIYLDDVVVALFATGEEAPQPIESDPAERVRVVPRVAYECQVEVLLELDEVPSDVDSVAIAYVRHPGAELRGRPAIECASASLAMELPVRALADLPPDDRGLRRLALSFSEAPDDFDDLGDEGDYCSTPYAVIACVRDASGLHALPGARGRWAQSGVACFSGNTRIATEDGELPIASLGPGMRVIGFDPNRGETVVTEVTRLIPRGERAVLGFTLSNGGFLRVTAEHPLFDAASGIFRRAETFVAGDRLRGLDGSDVLILRLDDRGERTAVFDLSVRGPHTYFAGGVVAHNY